MREWVRVFKDGISIENPLTILMIGLCATLAVSTQVQGSLFMGIAVIFVLVMSNVLVSAFRRFIPNEVRIPVFIVIIASFVTIVDLVMKAFFPPIYAILGIWIPLIVVNCIILGRAEAFAACRYAIERLKQVAPVWKRECFEDGSAWVEGAAVDARYRNVPELRRCFALQAVFHFHPLAIEDCHSNIQRPKIDEDDDHLFIVMQFPVFDKQNRITRPSEVDVFIGEDYVVTVHCNGDLKPLSAFFRECQMRDESRAAYLGRSSGYLLYHIIDRLVNYCFPILNHIS